MANIVVTSTTNSIRIVFNDYATQLDMVKGSWNKSYINSFILKSNFVLVDIESQQDWLVSFDGVVGTLQIDSIDGVALISNSDLYDKLNALIA